MTPELFVLTIMLVMSHAQVKENVCSADIIPDTLPVTLRPNTSIVTIDWTKSDDDKDITACFQKVTLYFDAAEGSSIEDFKTATRYPVSDVWDRTPFKLKVCKERPALMIEFQLNGETETVAGPKIEIEEKQQLPTCPTSTFIRNIIIGVTVSLVCVIVAAVLSYCFMVRKNKDNVSDEGDNGDDEKIQAQKQKEIFEEFKRVQDANYRKNKIVDIIGEPEEVSESHMDTKVKRDMKPSDHFLINKKE